MECKTPRKEMELTLKHKSPVIYINCLKHSDRSTILATALFSLQRL